MKLFLASVIMCTAAVAQAQQELGFNQAFQLALKNNKLLLAASSKVTHKKLASENVAQNFLPRLSANFGGEYLGATGESKSSGISTLTGSYILYDGNLKESQGEIARGELELAEIESSRTSMELAMALKKIYVDVHILRKKKTGSPRGQLARSKEICIYVRIPASDGYCH